MNLEREVEKTFNIQHLTPNIYGVTAKGASSYATPASWKLAIQQVGNLRYNVQGARQASTSAFDVEGWALNVSDKLVI